MEVQRICEHCNVEFTARTTVTRFCSDKCAKANYKLRKKLENINRSNKQTGIKKKARLKPSKDLSKLEYLTPTDTAKLMQCSRVYIYKLMDEGKLPFSQLSVKKRLISRNDIERYLSVLKSPTRDYEPSSREKLFDLNNSLTMQEAQKIYNVSEKALYDIVKRNKIRKYQKGKYVFIEIVELDKVFQK